MKHVSTQVAVWRAGLGMFASASLLLAGCSSSSNSTATQSSPGSSAASAAKSAPGTTPAAKPAVAQGAERGIGDVPWAQVGPGMDAGRVDARHAAHALNEPLLGDPTPETATDVLYPVSPAGDRYSITEFRRPRCGNRSTGQATVATRC